jgi:hypothetical protein
VTGDIALGAVNLPAVIGTAVGAPPAARGARGWPAEPFEHGVWADLAGEVAVRIGRVGLTPGLAASDVRAVVKIDQGELTIDDIDGTLANGRVAGRLAFQSGAEGLTVETNLRIAGAEASALLPGDAAISGQTAVNLHLTGSGRSPTALIGGLKGEGSFTLQDGKIARLDPAAFEAVTRSVDQGLPIDTVRIRDRMETALGAGALPVSLAEGEISMVAGQMRLANTVLRTKGAGLAVSASFDFATSAIDARLELSGPPLDGAPGGSHPEVVLSLRGPLDAPRRTLDVAPFANWLAQRLIEEKAKRIDALEAERRAAIPDPSVVPPAEPPAAAPPETAPPANVPPVRESPAVGSRPTAPPLPDPPPRAAPKAPPAARAPATPPVDIRPPPAARPQNSTASPESQPRQAQPSRPPDTRSWLERLIGP